MQDKTISCEVLKTSWDNNKWLVNALCHHSYCYNYYVVWSSIVVCMRRRYNLILTFLCSMYLTGSWSNPNLQRSGRTWLADQDRRVQTQRNPSQSPHNQIDLDTLGGSSPTKTRWHNRVPSLDEDESLVGGGWLGKLVNIGHPASWTKDSHHSIVLGGRPHRETLLWTSTKRLRASDRSLRS